MKRTWITGAAMISAGSLLGSAIAFAASIALARLYSPAEHGTLSVTLAFAAIITPLLSGRIEAAMQIPESDAEAAKLAKLGIYWALALCVPLSLVGVVASRMPATVDGDSNALQALWVVPLMAALTAIVAILNQFCVRQQRYAVVGVGNAVYSSSTALYQILLSVPLVGAWGLIIGVCLGRVTTAGIFIRSFLKGSRRRASKVQLRSHGQLARRFWRFPTVLAGSAIINAIGLQAPVLLIAYAYGEAGAGLYGMSQRTLSIPVSLIGIALGQVFISELGRAMRAHSGEAMDLFIKGTKLLLVAGVALAVVLMIFGPFMFDLVFGDEWRRSGEIARAMSINLCAQLVASPLSQALVVYERYYIQLSWDVSRLLAISGAVVVPAQFGVGLVHTCWIIGGVGVAMYTASWLLSRHTIKYTVREPD